MRVKLSIVLTAIVATLCGGGAALGIPCSPNMIARGAQPPVPVDQDSGMSNAYREVLRAYNANTGEAHRIAGRQDQPDVGFAILYEAYVARNRRFNEQRTIADSISRALRVASEHLQGLADASSRGQGFPLGASDLRALQDMERRLRPFVEAEEKALKELDARVRAAYSNACSAAPQRVITIIAATYGMNCIHFKPHDGRANKVSHGNATSFVAPLCNGKSSCAFRIEWQKIGDPAYGCMKDFAVSYLCDGKYPAKTSTASPEAGHGSTVTMSCQ
jgi:hypothetical protein